MSNKYWVLMRREKLVKRGVYHVGGHAWGQVKFNSFEEAKQYASGLTKKYSDDIHIMQLVAFATVPTTVIKVE